MKHLALSPPPQARALGGRDLALALMVVTVWAANFVIARWGLRSLEPFTLAAYRFFFTAFPAVFFVRRPNVSWRILAAFGVILAVPDFGLLYLALQSSITSALASIVIQMQAFFTALLAAALFRERLGAHSMLALLVAGFGLAIIGVEAGTSATPGGLALVLVAASAWAVCNIIAKRADTLNMLGFVAWSSLFAVPPLLCIAFFTEGPEALLMPVLHPTSGSAFVIFWQAVPNSLIGYAIWNSLFRRYPASTVAPLGLLVPVIATALSWMVMGEAMPAWKLGACALVLSGLAINQLGGRQAASRSSGHAASK